MHIICIFFQIFKIKFRFRWFDSEVYWDLPEKLDRPFNLKLLDKWFILSFKWLQLAAVDFQTKGARIIYSWRLKNFALVWVSLRSEMEKFLSESNLRWRKKKEKVRKVELERRKILKESTHGEEGKSHNVKFVSRPLERRDPATSQLFLPRLICSPSCG